jgi:hypothetical protein
MEKYHRFIRTILDKLTPQTYEVSLKQLDAFEFNSNERLEILISIILIKVDETNEFSSLYATLCKHFQNKQVTLLNENGQSATYCFTEILLTRCQKVFETNYRQEINLHKAKQKKLRYIKYVKQ